MMKGIVPKILQYALQVIEDPCMLIMKDLVTAKILNTKYCNLYNSVPYDEVEMN